MIFGNLAAQRIPVHAELIGGLAETAVGFRQHMEDEAFFEFAVRLFVADVVGHHLAHEPIKLFAQRH